jgi:hypothetical protein
MYRISNTHNMLVVVGYTASERTEGGSYSYTYFTGCMSYCNNSASAKDGLCAGVGCCHVNIPPGLTGNTFDFREYDHSAMTDYSPCDYVFLVDMTNYTFRRSDLLMDRNRTSAVWLDWAIRDNNTASGDVLSCAALQECSRMPTALGPRRIDVCRRRMIRRGLPSAYGLGVDLPRRKRAGPRRTGPLPTAGGALGVLALGVLDHGASQAKRQLGHTPRA